MKRQRIDGHYIGFDESLRYEIAELVLELGPRGEDPLFVEARFFNPDVIHDGKAVGTDWHSFPLADWFLHT